MKTSQIIFSSPWLTFLIGLWLYNFLYTNFAASQCMNNQKSLLLHLKNNLKYDPYFYPDTIVRWNESTDCCLWSGVECDLGGRVIGLDLSDNDIVGGIDNSSSLFRLQFLQRLNLADNYIEGEIPSAIGKLSSLTYLNLSETGFSGQVPIEISQLSKLIVLDISKQDYDEDRLYMKRPNLTTIIQNLTNMRELILDGVDNSAMEISWCDALSSSLPHLQVLRMSSCDLRGDIYKSLSKLKHLSVISLSFNPLESPLPEFLTAFTNLTTLECHSCSLTGKVPTNIFNIPTLKTIGLSNNDKLQGILPVFYKNGSLEEIDLSYTNFSGVLPKSISNIKRLRKIDLSGCKFWGSIPSFSSAKKLKYLFLSRNNLSGSLNSTDLGKLINLDTLDLGYNSLDGSIPVELFSLSSLRIIGLEHNKFSGQLREFEIVASSNLISIELDNNNLEGSLPKSIFRLTNLINLQLNSNKFNGTLKLRDFLQNLIHLSILDLSHNYLSIDTYDCGANSSFFDFIEIGLASCNLSRVPDFVEHQISLSTLDLSKNHIVGGIPSWICNATVLMILDLQYNHFSQTIPDCLFSLPILNVLSLRGNMLTGGIPAKFENDNFLILDLNGNFLRGHIPVSLANSSYLMVLDLGYNQFYDTFPCHLESMANLQVLVLRSNTLQGTILCPGNHSVWPQLRIMDLASNHFSGRLTDQMFVKFKSMMIQSVNQPYLSFTFVLEFSDDDYYGDAEELTFKGYTYLLQKNLGNFIAIDFSDNAFHGELPKELGNLKALIVLNFSHNSLSGNIPSSFGNLSLVESLDLSCNYLSGKIPPQFANLNFLEYLNLSYNKLSGKIPTGTQLQSFSASSYEGNQGLYGPPLTHVLGRQTDPSISSQGSDWSLKSWLEWMIRGAEVGFPVGFSIVIVPLLYIKRWREWYYKNLNILIMKILHKEHNTTRRQQRHRN